MQRTAEECFRGRQFHDLPRIHHCHAVGQVAHDAKAVRDEQNAHAEALFHIAQQIEDLRLDGHVQRGRRLVSHEQFRPGGQRHRDHHALLHSAGKLVRIITEARFRRGYAHEFQQPNHLFVAGFFGPVQSERFLDLAAGAKDGIQRCARFLENVADRATADFAQFAFGHPQNVPSVEQNLPPYVACRRRRHQPRDGMRREALAATALAHQTDRFASLDG